MKINVSIPWFELVNTKYIVCIEIVSPYIFTEKSFLFCSKYYLAEILKYAQYGHPLSVDLLRW